MVSFFKSFVYAFNGLRQMFFVERNFTIHIIAAFVAVVLCVFLNVSDIELLIVIICIGLVIGFEVMNSAIEKLCNFVSPEWNENIKIIKDMSAAAVLVVALLSFVIGIVIFVPKIVNSL